MPLSPGQAESRPYVPACPQARKSHRRACAPFGSAHVHPAYRVAPARDQPSLLTPLESGGPLFLHRLDVLAFFTVENVNVRQSVQVNTANKSHRSLATRTSHLDRTILRFGRFHLPQCSALPARRIPKKVSATGQMPWTLNSVPVGFPMKLNSARALMLELFKGHRV